MENKSKSKSQAKEEKDEPQITERKLDWHLFWTAIGVVFSLSSLIVGCYISLKTELTTIKTVLIIKGIMPAELAAKNEHKK